MLAGCGSIAEGVTTALLESSENREDTRSCHIQGPSSSGLMAMLREQEKERIKGQTKRTLKIIMVHGIGRHLPGYSGRLQEKLTRALKLDAADEIIKRVKIQSSGRDKKSLGVLQVHRYLNKARKREVLFYELTWSDIGEPARQALAFDESNEQRFRRSGINKLLKSFFNNHVPGPLIYVGNARHDIQTAVQQTFCWATTSDWNGLPEKIEASCDLEDPQRAQEIRDDDFAVITHSMGSRIVVDMIQEIGSEDHQSESRYALRNALREMRLPIYMLANQLPLLQLGREPIAVRNKIGDYCRPSGPLYSKRQMSELAIYAFSDPNDILSYAIKPDYAAENIDSRLCPRVTNIVVNVAKPISLFGFSDFANPLEAHNEYDNDSRVISIIVEGIGSDATSAEVKRRCTHTETIYGG